MGRESAYIQREHEVSEITFHAPPAYHHDQAHHEVNFSLSLAKVTEAEKLTLTQTTLQGVIVHELQSKPQAKLLGFILDSKLTCQEVHKSSVRHTPSGGTRIDCTMRWQSPEYATLQTSGTDPQPDGTQRARCKVQSN